MPLTLTYFPVKGRAELIRYILAYAGENYIDQRVTRDEWISGVKSTSPTGAAPILTLENGQKFSQSRAIARYLAGKFGLAGKSEEDKLYVDMVVDMLTLDIADNFTCALYEKDTEKKTELVKAACEKSEPLLTKLNDLVAGPDTFLESGVTWADLALFNLFTDLLPQVQATLKVADFDKLNKVYNCVANEPKIAAWIAERPVSSF